MVSRAKDSRLELGGLLLFVGGLFPLFVGLRAYFITISDRIHYGHPLDKAGLETYVSSHVGYANLTMTGIFICFVTRYALLKRERWAWWVLLCSVVWAGGNDTIALIEFSRWMPGFFPIAIIPTLLGLSGLLYVRKSVFGIKS